MDERSGDLGAGIVPSRNGNSEAKISKTDGIVGAKGRFYFGDREQWYVPWYIDVGTGQTDLTWQAIGGLGYSYNWGEIFAVWRYLDYNFKSSSKIEDVNFSGPAIGVEPSHQAVPGHQDDASASCNIRENADSLR